jgi:sensor histidine kinase YesM
VRNTQEDIGAGFEAGANDFLAKPFNSKELKARVRTLEKMKDSVIEALKMETVFLQSQIKPHFFYNALSIIISLCYSDGELAGRLLGELSKYLRFVFDINPYNSFVSLKEEISFVKTYVELEKARFGDRLKIEFNVDEAVLNYRIPALIIQPIVENSIRHGLMKRISGGIVSVSIKKYNNYIRIMIQDDGVGIDKEILKSILDSNSSINSGLRNVNKRLLNEYGQGLLIDSSDGKGTNTIINIPIK